MDRIISIYRITNPIELFFSKFLKYVIYFWQKFMQFTTQFL